MLPACDGVQNLAPTTAMEEYGLMLSSNDGATEDIPVGYTGYTEGYRLGSKVDRIVGISLGGCDPGF